MDGGVLMIDPREGTAPTRCDASRRDRVDGARPAADGLCDAAFARSPVGVAITDLHGFIRRANPAFCRLVAESEAGLLGRSFLDLAAPEQRDELRACQARLGDGADEAPGVVENQLQRADGSRVWVRTSTAVERDAAGLPLHLLAYCEDITRTPSASANLAAMVERRTAELLEQAKQLDAFCHTISHDLRAPLRAIAGYAQFLREDHGHLLPADGLESLHHIEASAARLDRLIGDLLGYTRLRQGPVIREDVELDRVLERVVWNLRRDHLGSDSDVHIEIRAPLGTVRAHEVALDHVFQNLLSNAVKFRQPSLPLRLVVRGERRSSDGALRVWVEDNGLGVEPRSRERIFQMFERSHPERKIEGTGIGLAIVATLIERLGGRRGVEPNFPSGSRFWIEFPADAVAAAAVADQA